MGAGRGEGGKSGIRCRTMGCWALAKHYTCKTLHKTALRTEAISFLFQGLMVWPAWALSMEFVLFHRPSTRFEKQ